MADAMLLTATRHNCWANQRLIEFCARLSPEQLAWTVPGTFGSIHATLQHTIGAEQGYLRNLTGELPPRGAFTAGQALVPLEELLDRAKSNAERIERHLASGDDPDRRITRARMDIAAAKVIVAQFIHHGSDHRAQVGTILGAHGMTLPELELDVWSYGFSTGDVIPPPAA